MRRLFLLLGLVGVLGMVSGSSAATHVAAGWGSAVEVPGTGALNRGGEAEMNSISCVAAGACAAGGSYADGSGNYQAFVASEKKGVWRAAVEVPGTATLNSGGNAFVDSVSCGKAGDCTAGGSYLDGSGHYQAFVASEKKGVWRAAVEVPGTATLNSGGNAQVRSVSCAKTGTCTAGGYYADGSIHYQAFVASETNGVWGNAVEVPGTATLNSGGNAPVRSVSCAKAGTCTAGGRYEDGSSHYQAFVASETNGAWGNAVEVPGTATLNSGGDAGVGSVSCATAGECTAGGYYADGSDHFQAFVASETNGVWGNAIEVPGTATLNSGGNAYVSSVSCAAAGDCTAGGSYLDGSGHYQAFVASETNGVWGNAVEVPGTATLNSGGNARVYSVSCATAGTCTAGGSLRGRLQPLPGVRGQRDERRLGQSGRSPRHRDPQQRRQRQRGFGVVCQGGRVRGRRLLHARLRPRPRVRGGLQGALRRPAPGRKDTRRRQEGTRCRLLQPRERQEGLREREEGERRGAAPETGQAPEARSQGRAHTEQRREEIAAVRGAARRNPLPERALDERCSRV